MLCRKSEFLRGFAAKEFVNSFAQCTLGKFFARKNLESACRNVVQEKTDLLEQMCLSVGFATGVAVAILSILSRLNMTLAPVQTEDLLGMVGVGIVCLTLPQLKRLGK